MAAVTIQEIVFTSATPNNNIFFGNSENLYYLDNTYSFSQNEMVMANKEAEVLETYNYLHYNNPIVLEIAFDIINELKKQGKNDFVISKTGDDEILIYRKINGEYRNLIIDEDCDVIYLNIPVDRRNSHNEFYPFAIVNANTLASKL